MPRVAVVGAGQIAAQKVYLPVLVALEDVELAVLVEPRRQRRQAVCDKYRFASAVASVEDIAPGQADCAFLLTRPSDRLEPLRALFQRGLDVLMEKPMAADLAQAEACAALAQQHGCILMVGFNRRFMPAYRQAREFLAGRPIRTCRVWKQGARLRDRPMVLAQ